LPANDPGDVTRLLAAVSDGSPEAVNQLLPMVYDELRRLAAGYFQAENPGHTLQPTALVHEAYLKLVDQRTAGWQDRMQFFGVAAQAMRRILVDHARTRRAGKRDPGGKRVPLDDAVACLEERAEDLVAVDEALARLARFDERKARVVELRFFGGLTVEDTANVLGVSGRTVEREWTLARAWLRGEVTRSDAGDT
jgi:RNA polymerase sigma factor (TIGR02999 family)